MKAEQNRIDLPREVALFLANATCSNVRELEGLLIRLGAYSSLTSTPITLEMARQTAHLGVPLLMGIMPLVGERNCEYLHNEVPGISIPDAIRARMKGKEKEEGSAEGLAIARELIDAVRSHIDGFYIIAPFGRAVPAAELVRYIKEL